MVVAIWCLVLKWIVEDSEIINISSGDEAEDFAISKNRLVMQVHKMKDAKTIVVTPEGTHKLPGSHLRRVAERFLQL